jgi:hypothetical protein
MGASHLNQCHLKVVLDWNESKSLDLVGAEFLGEEAVLELAGGFDYLLGQMGSASKWELAPEKYKKKTQFLSWLAGLITS